MASLLYIGQTPAEGTGSPVVILRHLRRFSADGWEIRIVSEYGREHATCLHSDWQVISLPRRRLWWPPYRRKIQLLRWLRFRLIAYEIVAAQKTRPDVVLSYLAAHSDFTSGIAAHFARVSQCPLHFLVHDEASSFLSSNVHSTEVRRNHIAALKPAATAWFVSEQLADTYPTVPKTRRRVLLPLPEGRGVVANWHNGRAALVVYYAGHVWPEQVSLLESCAMAIAAIGGKLVVIANRCELLEVAASRAPIELKPLFQTNLAALDELCEKATAVIISYAESIDAMPWSRTSFPSKLIEYLHIGLPLALVAPSETAVQLWAKKEGVDSAFQPGEMSQLCLWLSALKNARDWNAAKFTSLDIASGASAPIKIHGELDFAFRSHVSSVSSL